MSAAPARSEPPNTKSAYQRFADAVSENLRSVGLPEAEPLPTAAPTITRHGHSPSVASASHTDVDATDDDDSTSNEQGNDVCVDESEESDSYYPRSKSRSASSVYTGSPPLSCYAKVPPVEFSLDEDKLEIRNYTEISAFLADLATVGYGTPADESWRLNAVLGPAWELAAQEAKDLYTTRNDVNPRPRNPHTGAVPRLWIAVWSETNTGRRLDLVVAKANAASPIVIASPLALHAVAPHIQAAVMQRVCLKLKTLFPPSLSTPGGSVRPSFLSPINNVYACLGPLPLVNQFAQIWSSINTQDIPSSIMPSSTMMTYEHKPQNGNGAAKLDNPPLLAYRIRKMKLVHCPHTYIPTAMPLMSGFTVRKADSSDELKSIAKMLRDYRGETNSSNREHVSFDACLRDIDKAVRADHVWVYECSSKTMPGLRFYAGFCTVGSETANSIAITELYTGKPWRKRGVAESILREVMMYYLGEIKKKQMVCLLPDNAEGANRACARVGFRVLERSRWEETSEGEESGQPVQRAERSPEDPGTYLSWERWALARFTAVSTGLPWHQIS